MARMCCEEVEVTVFKVRLAKPPNSSIGLRFDGKRLVAGNTSIKTSDLLRVQAYPNDRVEFVSKNYRFRVPWSKQVEAIRAEVDKAVENERNTSKGKIGRAYMPYNNLNAPSRPGKTTRGINRSSRGKEMVDLSKKGRGHSSTGKGVGTDISLQASSASLVKVSSGPILRDSLNPPKMLGRELNIQEQGGILSSRQQQKITTHSRQANSKGSESRTLLLPSTHTVSSRSGFVGGHLNNSGHQQQPNTTHSRQANSKGSESRTLLLPSTHTVSSRSG
ncbi:unnamed protein product, partial [Choristocarpus tenellus]